MARLSGGPWRRGTKQGKGKGFMICEKGKFLGFKEKAEMGNGGVSCEEFTIKGGVFQFGGG